MAKCAVVCYFQGTYHVAHYQTNDANASYLLLIITLFAKISCQFCVCYALVTCEIQLQIQLFQLSSTSSEIILFHM